jgi:hypothetical protein
VHSIPARPISRARHARRRWRPTAAIALLAALALLAPPSAADLLLTTETRKRPGAGEIQRRGRIWLADDRIRLELTDTATGEHATVIFRGDLGLYWALDPAHERYLQIDRATMAHLGERVRATRREMAAKLEQMSPADRARAEAMLADLMPPAAAPRRERVRATGEHATVSGLETRRSELLAGERIVGEAFWAPFAAVGIEREQLSVFGALAAFQRDLMQTLGGAAGAHFGGEPFELFEQLDGYPLLIRRLNEGGVESETRFEVPERVGADETRYAPPAGYTRRVDPGSAP